MVVNLKDIEQEAQALLETETDATSYLSDITEYNVNPETIEEDYDMLKRLQSLEEDNENNLYYNLKEKELVARLYADAYILALKHGLTTGNTAHIEFFNSVPRLIALADKISDGFPAEKDKPDILTKTQIFALAEQHEHIRKMDTDYDSSLVHLQRSRDLGRFSLTINSLRYISGIHFSRFNDRMHVFVYQKPLKP